MVCNGEACGFSYRSPAEAVTADLIIFAVKFMGMESALETVKPFVGVSIPCSCRYSMEFPARR